MQIISKVSDAESTLFDSVKARLPRPQNKYLLSAVFIFLAALTVIKFRVEIFHQSSQFDSQHCLSFSVEFLAYWGMLLIGVAAITLFAVVIGLINIRKYTWEFHENFAISKKSSDIKTYDYSKALQIELTPSRYGFCISFDTGPGFPSVENVYWYGNKFEDMFSLINFLLSKNASLKDRICIGFFRNQALYYCKIEELAANCKEYYFEE